ncbi:UNKNOWN [Stylonychia lemnae]|uniref:C3H1-type domain-containing protein n=1 Tax=Stylonychia lemnae TaxID=5949 RepID=A0A078A3Z0_STYLE|nr:UNKNOWN [Stylonychia lemnae]|eukprot:CDW76594.1 UNKNOWN [Stylonychia lemnae]
MEAYGGGGPNFGNGNFKAPNYGGGGNFGGPKMGKNGAPKKPVCKWYLSQGGCKKGNQCNFHHPKNPKKHQDGSGGGHAQWQGGPHQNKPQQWQNPQGQPHGQGGQGYQQQPMSMPYLGGMPNKKPCKFGANCFKKDTCTFSHEMGGNIFPAAGQSQGHTGQSAPHKVFQQNSCNDYLSGACERVKCKYPHILPNSGVQIKLEQELPVAEGKVVTSGQLINNKTQVLIVTEDEQAYLFNVKELTTAGPIKLLGKPTSLRTFEAFQNAFFLGLQTNSMVGGPQYNFNILLSDSSILKERAHNDMITDIEYSFFNNQHIFFTCSLDGTIKAWTVGADQKSLTEIAQTPLPGKPLQMQLVSQDFLVVGLDNGCYTGWNLLTNGLDKIEAHKNGRVMTLKKFNDFLLSGDSSGFIQIRQISLQYNLLTPEFQIYQPNSISCFEVIQFKGEHLILAGDTNGMITEIKIDANNQVTKSSFGAFKDAKNKQMRVINLFQIEENSLYALGENGYIRKWTLI